MSSSLALRTVLGGRRGTIPVQQTVAHYHPILCVISGSMGTSLCRAAAAAAAAAAAEPPGYHCTLFFSTFGGGNGNGNRFNNNNNNNNKSGGGDGGEFIRHYVPRPDRFKNAQSRDPNLDRAPRIKNAQRPKSRDPNLDWAPRIFGLRKNAVTVFPGDFGDTKELPEGIEKGWREPDMTPEEFDTVEDQHTRRVQAQLRKEALEEEELKKRWLEKIRHPRQWKVKIDPITGCSYGRGARKAASAAVWMQPGLGEIMVNGMDYADYFIREWHRDEIIKPFLITETLGKFDIHCNVKGGGLSGQSGAIRLGIARCLNNWNPDKYRPALKFQKLLTRDPRRVERKKVGLLKARKAPQWVKR